MSGPIRIIQPRARVADPPGRRSRRSGFVLATRVLGVIVVITIVVPLVLVVYRLIFPDWQFNAAAFVAVWNQNGLLEMLRNTVVVIVLGTLGAVIVGTLFAWLNERTNARIGWLTEALPVMPLFIPSLAMAIGWILLASQGPGLLNVVIRAVLGLFGVDLGRAGPIDVFSWPGMLFLYVLTLVPNVYLTVSAAFRNLDPALEEASRANGAGLLRTLRKVTVPSIGPAILSGWLLSVASGFALFSIPVAIGTPAHIDILSVRIVRMVTSQYPPDLAGAIILCIVIVAFIGATWITQRRVARLSRHAVLGAGRITQASAVRLGGWRWPARIIMLCYLLATVVLPLFALFFVSVQSYWTPAIKLANLTWKHYASLFDTGASLHDALLNSLGLGLGTATLGMLIATLLAFLMRHDQRRPLGRIVDAVTKLPSMFSHIVVAIALLAVLSGPPLNLHGTPWLLLIGYLIVLMPQASISAGAALDQVGRPLSEASFLSGAGEGRTFRKIVVPLMRPGLLSGWVLVFVLAAGDLTTSALLASAQTPVVGFVMLDLTDNGTYGELAALGTVVTVIMSSVSIAMLAFGRGRQHRRSRAARKRTA